MMIVRVEFEILRIWYRAKGEGYSSEI